VRSYGVESSAITCRGLGDSLYETGSGSFSNLYRLEVASHSKPKVVLYIGKHRFLVIPVLWIRRL
jgi:hypothetical protein